MISIESFIPRLIRVKYEYVAFCWLLLVVDAVLSITCGLRVMMVEPVHSDASTMSQALTPQYAISVKETYTKVTYYFLEHGGSLAILKRTRCSLKTVCRSHRGCQIGVTSQYKTRNYAKVSRGSTTATHVGQHD